MPYTDRILAGVLFAALSAQFILALMIGAAIAPGYSIHANAISDLGVISATAALFNSSLFIAGLLNILGGYFFYRSHCRRWIFALFLFAGIGAMGAAVFPLTTPGIHGLFALVAFLFFNAQAVAAATRIHGPMKAISLIAGITGLFFLTIHAISDFGIMTLYGPIGHGGSERMIVYPALLWLIALGGYLMAQSRDDEPE